MSKALDYIKAALQIAFSLVVLAIILLNFRGLHLAVQKFLERAASVNAINGFGIEIDMDAADRALSTADAKRALFHVENLTGAEKRRVRGACGAVLNLWHFIRVTSEDQVV